MAVWLALVIAGLFGVGVAWKRASSSRNINAGQVSEGWLREQRAEKRDRYSP
jgi:high-affinity Fe2+/Pb2+ permease